MTLTCLTPGPGGTLLTLMLPGLGNGKPTPPGAYHVERPDEARFDGRVAWAEAQLTVTAPARYLAVGGTVRIDGERDDVLEGSYQLALLRAPDTDFRYPEHQVLWGAFRAPRSADSTTTRR